MAGLGTGYRNEPQPPHVGRRIAALAARQHGVVSAAQLRALGLGRSWMQRRLSAASLHPLHRGVYAVGHPSLSVRGKCVAAVLACGTGAVLSHRSAGALWGLWSGSAPISVTVPRGRTGPPALDVHQTRLLEPVDVTRLDAIPVTGVARTLLDLAAVLAPRGLARALDRSERLGLFDLAAVESTLARARGRRGAAALRHAIAAWRPRDTRSELEDRHHELLREADLPLPG